MNTLQAVGDFVEFYLSPYQSSKNIEFVQLKINQLAQKLVKKSNDELLLKVSSFQKGLALLKEYRKHPHSNSSLAETREERLYQHLTRYTPNDCLILIANERYGMNDHELSMIVRQSEESIEFRRKQLIQDLTEEGLEAESFSKLAPQKLTVQLNAPHHRAQRKSVYQGFQSLPFAGRFALETGAVLSTLVFLMWIIPEIRNTYENSVQKRINDYLIESSLVDSPAPEGTTKTPKEVAIPVEPDEAATDAAPIEASAASKKQPKVIEGETWRFSFTGSMTNELETGILDILRKTGSNDQKPLTVPGGIQFDFYLPVKELITLKTSLEDMTYELQRKSPSSRQNMMSAANMSWYKRKMTSTKKIPAGNVQVIIWISTL